MGLKNDVNTMCSIECNCSGLIDFKHDKMCIQSNKVIKHLATKLVESCSRVHHQINYSNSLSNHNEDNIKNVTNLHT